MVPKPFIPVTALLALLLSTAPSLAGKISELGRRIETSLAAGNTAAADTDTRALVDQVWAATPLTVTNVTLISGKVGGYGIYTPRKNDVYKPGEVIEIYAEPEGYGYGMTSDGQWKIGVSADVSIKSADGKVLVKLTDVAKVGATSHHRSKEFFLDLIYHINKAPPGEYLLTTRVHDEYSNKSTSFERTIEFRK